MRIQDVHAIQLKRARVNHETYKQLFQGCCDRIRRRATIPGAPRCMHYTVPPFVWGRPPYTHAHAERYVSEKLARNGFRVTHAAPGVLLVDWSLRPPKPPKQAPPKQAPSKKPKQPRQAKQPKLSARLEALRRQLGA